MPFALGEPFSVENSSADLLRFPPWAGDPGRRHPSTPFHHKRFSHSPARRTIFHSGSCGGMLAVFAELAIFGMILYPQKRGVSALPSVSPPLSSSWSARWLGSAARNLPQESAAFRKKLAGRSREGCVSRSTRTASAYLAIGHFWGLGTFPVVYPQFRGFYTNFFVKLKCPRLLYQSQCEFSVDSWIQRG